MSPNGVSDVVVRAFRRAGLPARGPHQLRHGTVAVTVTYATVDATLTRELARPWPGAR